MNTIQHISTVTEYNTIAGFKTYNPLVSVLDLSKAARKKREAHIQAISFGFYAVFLKNDKNCDIKYGRNYYDYQAGSLIFIAPGQVISIERDELDYQPSGHVLLFDPAFIRGTAMVQQMKEYSFFAYDVHEALHLSDPERDIVLDCFRKIEFEIQHSLDKHSKRLIVANIDLFLNYCVRFYDRQFITREHINNSVIEKFEHLLEDFFTSQKSQDMGFPSVSYFADQFHLSANYFGDIVKKQTGRSPIEIIHATIIEKAKEQILTTNDSISEVAYRFGYKYPQHFTRFFKQKTGSTPEKYRSAPN